MYLANESNKNGLLFAGFNQDYGCFACGTDRGFMIFNCDPLKERFRREFEDGKGIGIVEMLFRCNILALVGGGKNPRYPPNKVMIWDDYQNKCIAELDFRSEVKTVRLRRDRIVVALDNRVYVYNFTDLNLIDHFDTYHNPKGLLALSPTANNTVLATLGEKSGSVLVKLYDLDKKHVIPAHESSLSQIALNLDGTLLATASEKGTLIRIFDTASGNPVGEFRRGTLTAQIYNISFCPSSNWLCVSSDKGTVHIYSLAQNPESTGENRASSFSFMKDLILPSYFGSLWSCAQFHIPETRCICAFGQDNSIIVVCANGKYYKYLFDPVKKEVKQEGYAVFLDEDK